MIEINEIIVIRICGSLKFLSYGRWMRVKQTFLLSKRQCFLHCDRTKRRCSDGIWKRKAKVSDIAFHQNGKKSPATESSKTKVSEDIKRNSGPRKTVKRLLVTGFAVFCS